MAPDGSNRYASMEVVEELRRRMDEYGSVAGGLAALTTQVAELRQSMGFVERMLQEVRTAGREDAATERAKIAAEAAMEGRVRSLETDLRDRKGEKAATRAALVAALVALAMEIGPKLLAMVK